MSEKAVHPPSRILVHLGKDVGVGVLGHRDLGMAKDLHGKPRPQRPAYAAELYHRRFFPLLVFTGANAPATISRFPRGEAIHFREIAIEHGVPDDAILIETQARNTGENVSLTREQLAEHGIVA